MPKPQSNPEEKMDKLAAAIKRGWARTHPMTESQKRKVIGTLRNPPSPTPEESKGQRPEIDHGPSPG